MVLRALINRHSAQLRVFRASARSQGFASELAQMVGELKQAGITPERLEGVGEGVGSRLRAKLLDLAFLLRAYNQWLAAGDLHDPDDLLGLAAGKLSQAPGSLDVEGVWVDGFAELTGCEAEFLAALGRHCDQITLAFNVRAESAGSWLSPWVQGHRAIGTLQQRFREAGVSEFITERLLPKSNVGRFAASPALAAIEAGWEGPGPVAVSGGGGGGSLEILRCSTREDEARAAARTILKAVRSGGMRFRDIAALTRGLEPYHEMIARVFRECEIPCFIDRREAVSHHPFAELTRSALRTIAWGWQHEDWFSALKSGLVHPDSGNVDPLENLALAEGLDEQGWLKPFKGRLEAHEETRKRLVAPFLKLKRALAGERDGGQLAEALQAFWNDTDVEAQLAEWSEKRNEPAHTTLWRQMQQWLDDLRLAFADERFSLQGWLPIIESGLASQTVGLIPPSLDQVLVGAIDRSRNPDLKMAIVVGMNEGVFPSAPEAGGLISEWELEVLEKSGLQLGATRQSQVSREQFYGYIACTRASERLVVTFADRDSKGTPLKPSRFIARLKELSGAAVTIAQDPASVEECESPSEAVRLLLAKYGSGADHSLLEPVRHRLAEWKVLASTGSLARDVAAALYGSELRVSVSDMESFGSCPFRFYVSKGLRARERDVRKIDAREQGSFRHNLLAKFHERATAEGREWRDMTPAQAAALMQTIGEEELRAFRGGLLTQNKLAQFEAEQMVKKLAEFIAVIVEWMRGPYTFSPRHAELRIEWVIPIDEARRLVLQGTIDRVDAVQRDGQRYVAVIDYKSGGERLDALLCSEGIQLQLPAYLRAIVEASNAERHLGGPAKAAALFYVPLGGSMKSAPNRRDAFKAASDARAKGFKHSGGFDLSLRRLLCPDDDPAPVHVQATLKKDGTPHATQCHGLGSKEFQDRLTGARDILAKFAGRIFDGDISIAPYKRGQKTACADCHFDAICRFDDWRQPFRVLTNKLPDVEESEGCGAHETPQPA